MGVDPSGFSAASGFPVASGFTALGFSAISCVQSRSHVYCHTCIVTRVLALVLRDSPSLCSMRMSP